MKRAVDLNMRGMSLRELVNALDPIIDSQTVPFDRVKGVTEFDVILYFDGSRNKVFTLDHATNLQRKPAPGEFLIHVQYGGELAP